MIEISVFMKVSFLIKNIDLSVNNQNREIENVDLSVNNQNYIFEDDSTIRRVSASRI